MPRHHSLNYLEIPCCHLSASKKFFSDLFTWVFTDYPDPKTGDINYSAFSLDNIDGGFYSCDQKTEGGVLIVFYSDNLDSSQADIEKYGGEISTPIFSFPGGQRFHFKDPSGNEFAVWSDK